MASIEDQEGSTSASELAELRRQLEKREALLDCAADVIYAMNKEGVSTYANRATTNILGYRPDEFVGRNVHQLIHHSRADRTPYPAEQCPIQKCAALGERVRVENDCVWRRDGTPLYVDYRAEPLIVGGELEGAVVTMRELVDRKQLERAELAAAAQFQTLAETMPQLAWMAGPDGWIFWYNRRWYEYTGTKPEQMEGWGWQSVHDPRVLPQVLENWRTSIATGEPFEMVFPLRGADTVFRPFLTRIVPLRDAAGKIQRWFGTNTDISAQQQAESALRNSEERLRAALLAARTGTFRWDIKTNELEWDESLDRIFGLPPGKTARTLEDFIAMVHPDDRAAVIAMCERSAREGTDFELEFRCITPGGEHRWIYDCGRVLRDANGQPDSMTGACVDVTKRREADEQLRHRAVLAALGADVGLALTQGASLQDTLQLCTESLVRHLDAAFARIWTLDPAGRMLDLQASAGMYTHIDGDHAHMPLGKFKIGLIAEERLPHLTNDVLNDSRVSDPEWARREKMVAFAGYPLIVDREVIGVIALFSRHPLRQDVLEAMASVANNIAVGIRRKRTEEAVVAEQARKSAILETALDSIIVFDEDDRIIEFNPSAEKAFGYAREQVIGVPISALVLPGGEQTLAAYLSRHSQGLGRRTEMQGRRSDGSQFPLEIAFSWFPERDRALFTATLRDITNRKQFEEELRAAKEGAENANQAKSRFLANMSHELRTPLNAIIGYSEMLQEDVGKLDDPAFKDDLERIHTAGKHLLALINDVLDLSKIEAGRMDFYAESFETAAMIQQVAGTAAALAQKNGNTLRVNVAPDAGWMYTDLTKIRQSLLNLLSNAAKFTSGGEIALIVERVPRAEGDLMRFTVTDTGIGMAPEQLASLFEPFSQAHGYVSRKQGGSGLGLALTRRLCRLMGGAIAVESRPGQGTSFRIEVPAQYGRAAMPSPEVAPAPRDRDWEGSNLVLIIDDDERSRDLIRRTLEKEGIRTVSAANGEQGLRLAAQMRPAAITLDALMPGIDGWEVLSRLKSDPDLASIPVIMITIVEDRNRGYALGAAEYLSKPVDRERLTALLKRHRCPVPPCVVLLVDDDTPTRELLRAMLEQEGWRVIQAANGREALEILEEQRPTLVLLDLLMPEVDGFGVLENMRADEDLRKIPVIVLTAKDLTIEERNRLSGEVSRILIKGPLEREALLKEIRQVCGHLGLARPGQRP